MNLVVESVRDSFWMIYNSFWALVFGFALSGIIQAYVPRRMIAQQLGNHRPFTVVKATFLGVISSSCSYVASAITNSLYKKGADITTAMIFMFASTNLVVDLGLVMWRLMGWQFAVAELAGGVLMIVIIWILMPRVFPQAKKQFALQDENHIDDEKKSVTLRDASRFAIGDLMMMRVELIGGFLVAGITERLVSENIWNGILLHGHGLLAQVIGSIIGPIIACLSFVCSVGNVPLAAALWHSGITFSGAISFIYADLLSFPLLLIYKKYYGLKDALKIALLFWFSMSLSGFVVAQLFTLTNIKPMSRMLMMGSSHFALNITLVLNFFALIIISGMIYAYFRKPTENSEFAIDPVCGMQVRKNDAPAHLKIEDTDYYFCMEGCMLHFSQMHQ
jgi:uncharacterized membrane protein YraQ (UPF0718 family)/YHS domain-containing protein